jgi:hypothetical protein
MLTIVAGVLGCAVVIGFYGYVFFHLYCEHQKTMDRRKSMPDSLGGFDARVKPGTRASREEVSRVITRSLHRQALVQVGVAVSGLIAIFAEIRILDQLVKAFH